MNFGCFQKIKEPLDLHLINAMRSCSKLIVGRIHGKAVGGGVGIASACDYYGHKNFNKIIRTGHRNGPFVIEPVSKKIGKQLWPK
jgi:methylglutaconyl-CoA hydratase